MPIVRLARLFGWSEPEHRGEGAAGFVGQSDPSPQSAGRGFRPKAPGQQETTPAPLPAATTARFYAFVTGSGLNAVGIAVDRILGLREIVVRPLTDPLVQVPGIVGATDLGDGRVVLILDTAALMRF